jgi:hypothetical protein
MLGPRIGQGLEDGAVLAVHGQQVDPGALYLAQHQCAGHHHDLLVRQRNVTPSPNRRQCRSQPDSAHQAGHHQVRVVDRHGLEALGPVQHLHRVVAQQRAQLPRRVGVAHGHQRGSEALHLLGHHLRLAPGREGGDLEGPRVPGDDLEGLLADAPGTPQDGEALHASSPAAPRTCSPVRPKRRSRA